MGTNSTRQDFSLVQVTGGDLKLNVWSDDLQFTPNLKYDWNHYAVSYNNSGNILSTYINGELAASKVLGGALNTNDSNNIRIGRGQHNWVSQYYQGYMQEFSVFSSLLTDSEINDVYIHQAQSFLGYLTTGSQFLSSENATILYNPQQYSELSTLHSTVPYQLSQNYSELSTLHSTVPYQLSQNYSELAVLNSTITHISASLISGSVPTITGTVGTEASWDTSLVPFTTSSTSFRWSWQSVPAGSVTSNTSSALPDNKANTYFDMSNNKGLWHFEGGATDSSGDGNNGTVSNATLVAGKVGSQAYQFIDSDTSYVDFGAASNFLSAASPFSVAIWMKGDGGWTPAQYDSVLGFSNAFDWTQGMGIYWSNATTIRGFIDRFNNGVVDATISNVDEWNHIVMTYDQSDLRLYLNGALQATSNRNLTLTGLANNLQVGRLGTHGRLEASLDEFSIWERKLSDLEVSTLYFLQSGSCASDVSGSVGLGENFGFMPDVTGTYQIDFTVMDTEYSSSLSTYAYISTASAPPTPPSPVITGSNPTVKLVESKELGYVFNTYRIPLLSVQRSRTSEQVPFKLGTKGKQSLRTSTNTEFTGSS